MDTHPIDVTFKSYLEGKSLVLDRPKTTENTIWLKPNLVAP